MFLNQGKSKVALFIGGSSTEIPNSFIIGTGSGVVTATQTSLIAASDSQLFTSTDATTPYKVKWTADWNSVEMSGIQLREFAVAGSGSGVGGPIWSRTSLPAVTFDGTNELRIVENWVVY